MNRRYRFMFQYYVLRYFFFKYFYNCLFCGDVPLHGLLLGSERSLPPTTIFNNVGSFSLTHSVSSLLHNFGGLWNVTSTIQSFMSSSFEQLIVWSGPACAPLLWFFLGSASFWMSRQTQVTTVDIVDSRMYRQDRRTYERRVKKSLKAQMKEFRATPALSPRVHGNYLRHRQKKAPTIKARRQKQRYEEIFDSCEPHIRAPQSVRSSNSLRRRDRRWNKLFRTHLDGIRIREPLQKFGIAATRMSSADSCRVVLVSRVLRLSALLGLVPSFPSVHLSCLLVVLLRTLILCVIFALKSLKHIVSASQLEATDLISLVTLVLLLFLSWTPSYTSISPFPMLTMALAT